MEQNKITETGVLQAEKPKSTRVRINEIDIAKGIGIILVVIGHRMLEMGYSGLALRSFRMPMFFILVGLVMRVDEKFSLVRSIKAEKKVIVNYLLWSVVFMVFDIVVRMLILGDYNLSNMLSDVYMTCTLFGISELWFLGSLIFSKVISKWVIAHVKRNIMQFIIGCAAFIVIAFITKVYVSALGDVHGIIRIIYYPTVMALRTAAMGGFVICGYALKSVVNRVLKFKWGGLLALALLVNVFVAPKFEPYNYRTLEIGYPIITFVLGVTGFTGIMGISILFNYVVPIRKIFIYLGKHSLFIMVTHNYLLLGTCVANLLAPLFTNELFWLHLIVQIIVLVLIELVLCRWLEPWCNKVTDWMAKWRIFS